MRHVTWDDLNIFWAFCEAGTVRGAAKLLGVSHSTVARRLEELEMRIGAQLIIRNNTGFVLSESGEDVLTTAQNMRENMNWLERSVFGKDRQLHGKVTLAMLDGMAVPQFLEKLDEFRRTHPNIDLILDIRETLSNLDSGEADIAIRFGKAQADHHVGRHITPTARAVYMSASQFESQGGVISNDNGWISYTPPPSEEKWKLQTPFPKLSTHIYVTDLRAQLLACKQGLGLALLPCFLGDSDNNLVKLTAPEFPSFQHLWVVKTVEAKQNARVHLLSQFLVDVLSDLRPFLMGETLPIVDYEQVEP